MDNFHYDFMKKKSNILDILFIDSGSLCYECDEYPHEIMIKKKG